MPPISPLRWRICDFYGWLPLAATPRRRARINVILPLVVPFGHPKGTEKVPATSDSAGGPAQGARPLGTPKRRSRNEKAKTCRSAARFLTLFRPSPIDPLRGRMQPSVAVGADSISARSVFRQRKIQRANNVRPYSHRMVVCRGRRPRRPARLLPFYGRSVGRGLDPSLQYQWARERRGEQCSPVQFSGSARFCGRAMLAPTAHRKASLV